MILDSAGALFLIMKLIILLLLSIACNAQKGKITYKGVRIVMTAKDINVPALTLKYKWLQLEGPQAWIVTPDSLSTWISNKQSRDLKKRSRYTFRFTATNSAGKATIKDTTFIY